MKTKREGVGGGQSPVVLTIEKLIYGGDGLARIEDAKGRPQAAFVPFVLPGEEVEVIPRSGKSGFVRAELKQVLKASPERIEPGCPYFLRCGGCHYQHTSYENQLKLKQQILRETLQRTGKIDWQGEIQVHSAEPWLYRNRTRMHVHARDAKNFKLGYYRHNSRELLAIEKCPISSELINRAIAAIWTLGRDGKVPAFVTEIEFLANAEDSELLIEIYLLAACNKQQQRSLDAFAQSVQAALPEVKGFAAFVQETKPVFRLRKVWSSGEEALKYRAGECSYQVSAGSFFQTNRFLTEKLVELAVNNRSGDFAWDLYAGGGLFSAVLATNLDKVTAVESSPESFADLEANAPANVERVQMTTEKFLASSAKRTPPEFVIVDPPRAGLGAEVAAALAKLSPASISYVSCDPATLSRDLKVLVESGYSIGAVHLVDLFPQTFHMETVVHLGR